jgi:hypothetical protein
MSRRRIYKIGPVTIVTRSPEPEPESCASVAFVLVMSLLCIVLLAWILTRIG